MNYERLVRNFRQHIGNSDVDPSTHIRFYEVFYKVKDRMFQQRNPNHWRGRKATPEKVGPYSGLTKRELAASGTCETDWF